MTLPINWLNHPHLPLNTMRFHIKYLLNLTYYSILILYRVLISMRLA